MKLFCIFLLCLISATLAKSQINIQKDNQKKDSEPSNLQKSTPDEKKTVGKLIPQVSTLFRDSISVEKLSLIHIPRFEKPPVIDGKLDEAVWKSAAILKDFYQISPGNNIPSSKETFTYVGYDAENLYLAFYCFDDSKKVSATLAKRDNISKEDNVQIYLDTFNDQRKSYILGFNPYGIQQDGIYTEAQGADFSVDIVMESKGRIIEDGWNLEVRIPFRSLRHDLGKTKVWGIQVTRFISRLNGETDSWMPRDLNISSWLAQEGKIGGIENLKKARTLEFVPNLGISEVGNRKRTVPIEISRTLPPGVNQDPGKFVNENIKSTVGFNLKYNFTPNVTFSATVNPDFAEIESDAPIISANQRFPIFFEEKRPFFLEGIDIFQSPLQVFYSRQIISPEVAVKISGKVRKTSFGFLAASDKAPGKFTEDELTDPNNYPRIQEFLKKKAYFGIMRFKQDFGKENNIGFFSTTRVFPRKRNFLSGFDGFIKLNPQITLKFQIVGTYSKQNFYSPETDRSSYRIGKGVGYYLTLDRTSQNHSLVFEISGRSKDYRADSGFTRRTNSNTFLLINRFVTNPKPKANIIKIDWRQFIRINYDWQGRSQAAHYGTSILFNLQHNLTVRTVMGIDYERLFEEEFGAKRSLLIQGEFTGKPERSSYQPFINADFTYTINRKINIYGAAQTIINSFDYDFGNGNRFPRVSPAFLSYLSSPEYLKYLRIRSIDPGNVNNFPPPQPRFDPGTGQSIDLNFGGEYKPINALRISVDYTKSYLKRNETKLVAYDDSIYSLKSAYQFSRSIFIRTRVDYDSLQSTLNGQLLFGYNPRPGTLFYVGYNDYLNYNGFSPFTEKFEPNFVRNERSFFIRISYLFRKSF